MFNFTLAITNTDLYLVKSGDLTKNYLRKTDERLGDETFMDKKH